MSRLSISLSRPDAVAPHHPSPLLMGVGEVLGRVHDGRADPRISTATTNISRHLAVDLRQRRLGVLS